MKLIFEINEQEKKEILEQHNLMKKALQSKLIKVKINEQSTQLTGREFLISAREKGCPIAVGGEIKSAPGKPTVLYKKADYDSTVGLFKIGDELYVKDDYTFDIIKTDANGNKTLISNKKWSCSKLNPTPQVNQQQLTPQQQKSVDDLINFYKDENGESLYKKEEPTADQITKNEWKRVNLKDKKEFKDIGITFDYYVWEKTGLRQTQSPQQRAAIKTYTDAGWQDIGGKVNPAEADKYDTIDLIDIYPEDFKDSYKLVKPIESVDTNEVIKELNNLVGAKNFGDRKTCRNIISKYNVAKQKNAPVNDAVLRNWKIAVNACKTKVSNFNDLGMTNKILGTLTVPPTDRNGNPIAPKKDGEGKDIPPTNTDKRWNINLTKTQSTPAAGTTPPAGGTTPTP